MSFKHLGTIITLILLLGAAGGLENGSLGFGAFFSIAAVLMVFLYLEGKNNGY